MTVHDRERALESLERDGETVAAIVAEMDTARLHMIADAIRIELGERYEGKPCEKARLH
jgi:hypothetical protein